MTADLGKELRKKLNERRALLVPGAANALAARIIEDLGFEAVYLSGAGLTNTLLGIPDLGFISLPEIAQHTTAIREAVNIPLIVDADTGFGNALNVRRCVRALERAGANALQLEDQTSPKKCGHFSGKSVVSTEEMTGKIKAAVDARSSEDFLIIARTDARGVEGFAPAIERLEKYIEAGAEVTFLEAPESIEEIRAITQQLRVPQIMNLVVGGKSPILPAKELEEMRYGMVLYANVALQGAIAGMQRALQQLKSHGFVEESDPLVATFSERQRLVQKPLFDELERKYGAEHFDPKARGNLG